MGEAYAAVAECDRPVHVVYVLTDLARSAWDPGRPAEGLDKVEKIKSGKTGRMVTFVLRLTPAGDPQRLGRLGRAVAERRRPRASRSRSAPASASQGQGRRDPDRRVLPRRREEGREAVRDPARRRGRGQLPHAAEPQGGRAAPRRDRAERGARPARGRRPALLHVQGPPAPEGPDRRRPARSTPSSSPRRSIPTRRRRAPGRSWSSGTRPAEFQTRDKGVAGDLRLRLPAQRRPARRRGLGRAERLRPRGGRPGRRGRATAAIPTNYNGDDPRPAPAGAARAEPAPGPTTTFGKVADVTHPLFQRYGKDLDTSSPRCRSTATGASRPSRSPSRGRARS